MDGVGQDAAGLGALAGRRVLVVGASSGIGRAVALGAGAAGASVAVAARRQALLEEVAAEARSAGAAGAEVLACDVADAAAARSVAGRAAAALGSLDCVIYVTGTSLLAPLASVSAEQWLDLLRTNLVGAALVVAGALEPLRDAAPPTDAVAGRPPTVVVVSSHIVRRPWPGLVAYAVTKAALDALARGLREEEPWLRVVDVVVGNTVTGFADGWDPALAAESFARWTDGGYFERTLFSPEEMAAVILGAVADPDGPLDIDVTSPAAT